MKFSMKNFFSKCVVQWHKNEKWKNIWKKVKIFMLHSIDKIISLIANLLQVLLFIVIF